jgi:hypothetical protein
VLVPLGHNLNTRCGYTEIQRYAAIEEENKDTGRIQTQKESRKSEEGSDTGKATSSREENKNGD